MNELIQNLSDLRSELDFLSSELTGPKIPRHWTRIIFNAKRRLTEAQLQAEAIAKKEK